MIRNFKEFLNESDKPELPLTKQEITIQELFSMSLSPVIKKITEWLLYRYESDAEFRLYTVISASGKELVYYFQWEFDKDLPPDYETTDLTKLLPNCKVIELDMDYSMPSSELIGVILPGGNRKWINKVYNEEDAELYNGTMQKKFSPYEDLEDYVSYIVNELGLDPMDFIDWASTNLSVSAYQNKYRGKIAGRKYGL